MDWRWRIKKEVGWGSRCCPCRDQWYQAVTLVNPRSPRATPESDRAKPFGFLSRGPELFESLLLSPSQKDGPSNSDFRGDEISTFFTFRHFFFRRSFQKHTPFLDPDPKSQDCDTFSAGCLQRRSFCSNRNGKGATPDLPPQPSRQFSYSSLGTPGLDRKKKSSRRNR